MCGLIQQETIENDPHFKADLEQILRRVPSYLDIIIEECIKLVLEFRLRQTVKHINCQNILSVIQFSQNLMQYGWVLKDPFMQFPNLSPEDCMKLHHALGPETTIYKYAMMEKPKRREILSSLFQWNEQQFEEHEGVINCFPLIKATITAEVRGEDIARVGDLLHCKLKVEFLNLEEGQQSGYVHSRTYPFLRRENWYLVITEKTLTGLASVEKLPIEKNTYEREFSEALHRAGPIEFVCVVANDSYKGLDQMVSAKVVVHEADPLVQNYEYHEEDKAIIDDIKKKEKEDDEGEDTAAEDSDQDKPEGENDEDELIRRLKRHNLSKAADSVNVAIEERKTNMGGKTIEEAQEMNPFIPQVMKTIYQRRQEKVEQK